MFNSFLSSNVSIRDFRLTRIWRSRLWLLSIGLETFKLKALPNLGNLYKIFSTKKIFLDLRESRLESLDCPDHLEPQAFGCRPCWVKMTFRTLIIATTYHIFTDLDRIRVILPISNGVSSLKFWTKLSSQFPVCFQFFFKSL